SPLVVIDTFSSATPKPFVSFTVTVAVDVDEPSAGIDVGASASVIEVAPLNSVSCAVPMWPPLVAEIVSTSAVLEEWIVVDALPSGPVVPEEPLNVTSPLVPQLTVASGTGAPFESVTVAVAVDVEVPPSARIDDGESVTDTALGTPGVDR